MKKIITRSIVLLAIVALVFGSLPTDSARAAKKKSKTSITVSTQEELVKALKSGKYKKITIKTDAKVSFTLASKYSNSDLKIVVDAKNATFNSKGTVGSIVVNEAKTVKEYASGNNITVNDEKLTFKAMGGASVEKLKIASETGEVKVVNNGEIGRVDVTGESKVDVEQNGSVGRLYVAAAAEIGVTGTSEEKLAVTVKPEASGAAVKSELPVKVNAYADVDLQLEKGAENSAVTLKNEDAGVKLENNTDKKVTVTDSDGEKQTVKKGEDLTSDNYVGKPEETDDGTEGETSGTPSDGTEVDKKEDEDKEEEKKEDKEEEKKDDTTSTGGSDPGTSGGDYYYVPTAEETLISNLAAAERNFVPDTEPQRVYLTSNVTLTRDLTVPANTILFVGHKGSNSVLNTGSYKIKLQETATILVTPGSKLIVPDNSVELAPTDRVKFPYDEADAGIDIQPGGEVKYGAYTFTADNGIGVSEDYAPIGRLHWLKKYDRKEPEGEEGFHFELDFVEIQNLGGTVQITDDSGYGYDKLPEAFGLGNMILPDNLPDFEQAWGRSGRDDVLSALSYVYVSDVRANTFVTKFNNDVVFTASNTVQDWLNAYLDPERSGELDEAINVLHRTPLVNVTITKETKDSNGYVTSREATLSAVAGSQNVVIDGEVSIPVGTKLITKVPIVMKGRGSCLNVYGTLQIDNTYNDYLGISSIDAIDISEDFEEEPHEILRLQGWYGQYILGNGDTYYHDFLFPSDPSINAEPEMVEGIDCIGFAIEARKQFGDPNSVYYYWSYRLVEEEIDETHDIYIPHLLVMKKASGASAGKEVIPNPIGNDFTELDTLKAGAKPITSNTEFEKFLSWAWIISDIYLETYYPDGREENPNVSYADLYKASDGGYVNFVQDKFSTSNSCGIVLDGYYNERGEFCTGYSLASADLTLTAPANNTTDALRIKKEREFTVERGATLIVPTIEVKASSDAPNGKDLVMEYDDVNDRGARLSAMRGGAIQIGDIKITVPDNCSGWNEKGEPGLAITAEYDDRDRNDVKESYIRIQIPENAVIKKVGQDGALSDPSVDEFNTWLTTNNMHLDISYCSPFSGEFFETWERVEADELDRSVLDPYYAAKKEEDSWHVRRLKIGSDIAIVVYDDHTNRAGLKALKLPAKDGDYYLAENVDDLIAVYLKYEETAAAGIKVKINHPGNVYPSDNNCIGVNCKLNAKWTILVPNGKVLNVTPGSVLVGAITVASGGALDVQVDKGDQEHGPAIGELWTCENGNIEIQAGGLLRVHNHDGRDNNDVESNNCAKAVIKSGMGGKVKVASGASFMLYGNFECACSGDEPLFEVENPYDVTGFGFIALFDDTASATGVTNYSALKTKVEALFIPNEGTTKIGVGNGYGG